ncbi:MAG: DUF6395 domain-containing protein [Nitratireductor sp.]|uniref:DUF6395 domain-containing protein n=1 Tax=Nitratireductor sp. TaxID=1872084 RepID=UPI00260C9534|nr:DUF6395 domain-containing protein [Nitratireductor sp.]MCV0352778.1 DUF6395 domain-containing protein [Nitratireductor sp.]
MFGRLGYRGKFSHVWGNLRHVFDRVRGAYPGAGEDGIIFDPFKRGEISSDKMQVQIASIGDVELGDTPFIFRFSFEKESSERILFHLSLIAYDGVGRVLSNLGEHALPVFSSRPENAIALHLPVPKGTTKVEVFLVLPQGGLREAVTVRSVEALHGMRRISPLSKQPQWYPIDFSRHWFQQGSRVYVDSMYGSHWAEMPEGWRIEDVHPSVWPILEEFIFGRMENLLFGRQRLHVRELKPEIARPRGRQLLLAFSGGADCTAALELLPEGCIKFNSWRDGETYVKGNGSVVGHGDRRFQRRSLESYGDVLFVPQTLDEIPLRMGMTIGIKDPIGYVVYGLLLSSHLDVGALALGSVMEQCFLMSGIRYADVVSIKHSSMNRSMALLAQAGIAYTQPVAGCSEVITSKIVEFSKNKKRVYSCGYIDDDGKECGVCFKCFRKERMFNSNVPEPNKSVLKIIEKRPLKSATSVIYACQKSGWFGSGLDRYKSVRLDYLDRYYGFAVDNLVPEEYSGFVRERLNDLGIVEMNDDDVLRLKQVASVFWPEGWDIELTGLEESDLLPESELYW